MPCSHSRKTVSMEWREDILRPQPFYILPKLNCVQLSAVLSVGSLILRLVLDFGHLRISRYGKGRAKRHSRAAMHCRSGLVHVTVCIEAIVLVAVSTLVGYVYFRTVIVEMASVIVRVHCERPAASMPSHGAIEVCPNVSIYTACHSTDSVERSFCSSGFQPSTHRLSEYLPMSSASRMGLSWRISG